MAFRPQETVDSWGMAILIMGVQMISGGMTLSDEADQRIDGVHPLAIEAEVLMHLPIRSSPQVLRSTNELLLTALFDQI